MGKVGFFFKREQLLKGEGMGAEPHEEWPSTQWVC